MTTPHPSYYENIIARDPELRELYRRHRTCVFRPVRQLTSFTFQGGTEIYTFDGRSVTVRMEAPNASWQAPEEYLRPVTVPLAPAQLRALRDALRALRKAGPRTDACSLVNFAGGYMTSEVFSCRFRFGGSYVFAFHTPARETEPLKKVLDQIAGSSEEFRKIRQMRAWIFDFKRLERLKAQRSAGGPPMP